MKVKQNETFFHETYSNLTLFFIHCKTLKHFKEFCNWHRSISQQKGAQTSKMKWNKTEQVQDWQHLSFFTKYYGISMTFEIYFLMGFISNMNDNGSVGKMHIIKFYSVNVKGDWANLAEKNSQPRSKITAIFGSRKYFNRIFIKTF